MTKKNKIQSIALTKKQFIILLKAIYLGNWMANAYRTDDMQKDYESIEDYIFSLAPRFGLGKYVDHKETDGNKYYPTSVFEETTDVHRLHEAYDEESFWDELAERLGERDFFEKYSQEAIEKMNRDEWFEKLYECIDFYNEEFEKFGLRRIIIKK